MLIFQVGTFGIILDMTGGGPGTTIQVLSDSVYQDAFIGTAAQPGNLTSTLSMFMIVPIIAVVAVGLRRIIAGLTAGAEN